MVKAQHADNKEFFVAVIEDNAIDDFVLLLQAFSKFKKWQQSNMQLLVFPKYESLGEDIYEKHTTYKYRDDVRLLKDIEEKELAAIIASAHSFIHVSANRPQMLTIAVALQCSLPVISFQDEAVKEYAADAVLFAAEKNGGGVGRCNYTIVQR
jgi:glycosyltransferase involved in cell wall biosynthesis